MVDTALDDDIARVKSHLTDGFPVKMVTTEAPGRFTTLTSRLSDRTTGSPRSFEPVITTRGGRRINVPAPMRAPRRLG